jgi:transposase
VVRVEQEVSGVRVVHVQTASDSAATGCPDCSVVSTSPKEYVATRPRDLPYGERGISVVWHKVRWRCLEVSCARGSFTESIAELPARARTTGRLRRAIGVAVGDACRSVAEVAGSHGVSWPTAHAAFVEYADTLLPDPEPTAVLGIDETRRGKPRWVREGPEQSWRRG